MNSRFSNGNSSRRALGHYLAQIRSQIAHLNQVAGQTIRQNDSDLLKTHADALPPRAMQLASEIERASGALSEADFIKRNIRIQRDSPKSPTVSDQSLFHLSQKQLWSSFAREISKAIKRNL